MKCNRNHTENRPAFCKFPKGLISLDGKSGQFCRRWYRKIQKIKECVHICHCILQLSAVIELSKLQDTSQVGDTCFCQALHLHVSKCSCYHYLTSKKGQNKINTPFTATQHSTDDFNLKILNSPAHRSWNTIMPCAMPLPFSLTPNSPGNFSILSCQLHWWPFWETQCKEQSSGPLETSQFSSVLQ